MATEVELIYCADGNARFAQIAIDHGFTYGAQPHRTTYFPIEFADVHPKHMPTLEEYAAAVREKKPRMATVIDWTADVTLSTVVAWAEEIAPVVETIIIIPKVGAIERIPRRIGGKPIRLGYSVPTGHGGTEVPIDRFYGWPVHLLGGSPQEQLALTGGYVRRRNRTTHQMCLFRSHCLDVVSADGNMAHKMATRFCAFWDPDKTTERGIWPTLKDFDGKRWGDGSESADAPYEAFERSCKAIMNAWTN